MQVVGVVPTGWTYQMKRNVFPVRSKGSAHIHLVPYSEHSSFTELQEYVRFMRPAKARSRLRVPASHQLSDAVSQDSVMQLNRHDASLEPIMQFCVYSVIRCLHHHN